MNKKRPIVLDYNGQRILLDTIASYIGVHSTAENSPDKYGIRFYLRTGEEIERVGNDEVSRDKVLKFLDDHFKPDFFFANKCQVCVHKEDRAKRQCFEKHDCIDYRGMKGFKREKDDARSMDASNKL